MAKTWHIHIRGQVQGVGFRLFVYKKAQDYNLKGWVNNTTDGVHAEFNADEETARELYANLIENAPELSKITAHNLEEVEARPFDDFSIVHSEDKGEPNLLLTPDFALCNNCREELFEAADRRHAYPFITCTRCGPRYSVIENLPYDRERTTMESFNMCESCLREYNDPVDRRYYSQTNSCRDCGISMLLYEKRQKLISFHEGGIIEQVCGYWQKGNIVAIKGIGGYLLTCDASNKEAIRTLRRRKHRPAKPFALIYPDLDSLDQDMLISDREKGALTGSVSPILLLALRDTLASNIRAGEIAPGLSQVGVMIPYTLLYALLLKQFGHPIIVTSGNITNAPIVFKDSEALSGLSDIADYILTNDRDIVIPQDDSVGSFSGKHGQKIVIRRSRELAPTYINPKLDLTDETILATGAMLKSTFCYMQSQNIYISQYLGDLQNYEKERHYKHTLEHLVKLFEKQPEVILADKHPDYFSTRYAERLSAELGIPINKYQHHKAHFAAVMGEHNLIDSEELVLGVVWDGIGLGDDGQAWGGEFFTYQDYAFRRTHYFEYMDFILRDKMSREPRISALTAVHGIENSGNLLEKKFNKTEWVNYQKLLQKSGNLKTSSVGRLFDAVSSLLGIKDRSSYEGEAAMLLENVALVQ